MTLIIAMAAMAITLTASGAFAFSSLLNGVNSKCGTSYGCGLCHIDPGGGGTLTSAGSGYSKAGNDPCYFCPTVCAPPPPAPVCTDADGDGFFKESGCGTVVDCNDANNKVFPGATEICNDNIDNDCDGMKDCSDSNCATDPACGPTPVCTDSDGDGFFKESGCGTAVDCNAADRAINPGAAEACNDSKDNDCDGKADCTDMDCANDPACAPAPVCTDSDGDSYYKEAGCGTSVDCNDSDGAINPGATELCNDGIDNDCDGMIDCADGECKASTLCAPAVTPENCSDGIDNDGDGKVDCADRDCRNDLNCAATGDRGREGRGKTCKDGKDNDGDGLVDCADPDCIQNRSCAGTGNGTNNMYDDEMDDEEMDD
jgi:hypothetical protein